MSLESAKERFKQLLGSIGRAGLHSLYPEEFEYYACSLELVDSRGDIIESLTFPVMPSQISEVEPNIVNIKKSSQAVISLHTNGFIPFTINISGTFGRRLRLMIGNRQVNATAFKFNSFNDSLKSVRNAVFNTEIKTGYGALKVLEGIKRKSVQLDSYGLPYKLFFYNLSLNSNNLVEIRSMSKTMSEDNNMMWNYSIEMISIAPANSIMTPNSKRLQNLLIVDNLNKALDITMDSFREEFSKRQSSRTFSSFSQ